MEQNTRKKMLLELYHAALNAVDPHASVKRYKDRILDSFRSAGCTRLICVAFGKAACPMAKAVEDVCGDLLDASAVNTKYGHCSGYSLRNGKVFEGGHPLPDENGVRGTGEIVRMLGDADEHTFAVCLLSGGGSALLVSPCEGITLQDKQMTTDLLLRAGADIYELNAVRKHLSRVKGGRLAAIAYPSRFLSLILSDVIGDRLDVIASGPTSPDPTTYHDAMGVIEKYGLQKSIPLRVSSVLEQGRKGILPETPKEGDRIFENGENVIIGGNRIALEAAKIQAEKAGFQTVLLSSEITGEAREVGIWLAQKAGEIKKSGRSQQPVCLLSGGETTVRVKGKGTGGRNMELALAFAQAIENTTGITLLSAGTDGTDGPTDAAGAIVDGHTLKRAKALGIDSQKYLEENDSYPFLKETGDLLITGPTGTNVMDLQIVIIE
jgi:glycerate 2-kinase